MAIKAKKIQSAKTEAIESAKKTFSEYKDFIFADYRGLTVEQITALRDKLREKDAVLKVVKNNFARIAFEEMKVENAISAFRMLFDLFNQSPCFVRLWAWEKMDETIHGPRILETASEIFNRLYKCIDICATQGKCHHLDPLAREHVLALFYGYLLSLSICLSKVQRERENREAENPEAEQTVSQNEEVSLATERLKVVRELQTTILDLVYRKLGLDE